MPIFFSLKNASVSLWQVLEREAAAEKRLSASMAQLHEASAAADRMQVGFFPVFFLLHLRGVCGPYAPSPPFYFYFSTMNNTNPHNQTKLFEVVKQGEDSAAAAAAEAQILAELGEKHQSAAASLERENALLRARLEATQHAANMLNPLASSPSSPSSSSSSTSSSSSSSSSPRGGGGGGAGMLEAVDPIVLAAKVRQLESEGAELRGDNSRIQKEVRPKWEFFFGGGS